MIPVQAKPEPSHFDVEVRQPGLKFLATIPNPTAKQFIGHSYWTAISSDLCKDYQGICAYYAEWIPNNLTSPHIDHFHPKVKHPHLAYEWSNYRLASSLANTRKGTHEDILDPFSLQANWFVLDFPSLLVKANPHLDLTNVAKVNKTIKRLKLNEENQIKARQRWVMDYSNNTIMFTLLKTKAPFIAYELERQNLVDTIKTIFRGFNN
jgi:hypothetical protein